VDCPFKRTLDELGTKYGSYEVNKEEDGDIMMNVVSAVTGNRMVSLFYFLGILTAGYHTGSR
jgi:hypothetical protein